MLSEGLLYINLVRVTKTVEKKARRKKEKGLKEDTEVIIKYSIRKHNINVFNVLLSKAEWIAKHTLG